MDGFRAIKERARRDLHKGMQVPAYYYDPLYSVPVPLNVRVHNKWDGIGDVQGTSFRFAERREETGELIFWMEELNNFDIVLSNKAVVMISGIEGYRISATDPIYLQTQAAKVTMLSSGELRKYRSPEDGLIGGGKINLPGLTGAADDAALGVPVAEIDLLMFYTLDADFELPQGE